MVRPKDAGCKSCTTFYRSILESRRSCEAIGRRHSISASSVLPTSQAAGRTCTLDLRASRDQHRLRLFAVTAATVTAAFATTTIVITSSIATPTAFCTTTTAFAVRFI
jgi:hypothetical protein